MKKNLLEEKSSLYRESDLQRLRGMRLLDDDFMTKVFDGHPECIELILQIIMNKSDLKVIEVQTQVFIENILKKSVRFDVLATDSSGEKFNVEIQRADKGAGRKRARYNSSMMDLGLLDKGADFDNLPETYVIFITEHDVLKHGLPIYYIERWIENIHQVFDDGEHILYVNAAYRDETPIGKLMHDFSCTKPEDMEFKVLAERARYFKETEEGRAIMCRAFEEVRAEGIAEGRAEGRAEGLTEGTLIQLLKNAKSIMEKMNLSLEQAMDILGVSDSERQYLLDNIKSD